MSAKDPRKVMHVPLAPGWRTALRRAAKGRSLADVVRRAVADGLSDAQAAGPVVATSVLSVQLPRALRRRLDEKAHLLHVEPSDLVHQILRQRIERLASDEKIADNGSD